MAKKDKRGVNQTSILFNDETETGDTRGNQSGSQVSDANHTGKPKSFWSGLGRGERIGAVVICLLLAMGALGAGLGNKIISVFSSKAANINTSQPAQNNNSHLSTLNPFTPAPPPDPTPQLSKEYIYAGSRMLAVEDANANAAPPADLAVWRPSTGVWYVLGGVVGSQQTAIAWGGTINGIADKPVPGDYDGDGKTDFSVYRRAPSGGTGTWFISNTSNGNTTELQYGADTDLPAQADYDGDGKTDMAVYRPTTGYWYIVQSSTQSAVAYQFGQGNYTPVPADFDGDGKADIAVWYDAGANFQYLKSSSNYSLSSAQTITFGQSGDKPVVGDYDGDGKADPTVWKKSGTQYQYQWHVLYSSTQVPQAVASLGDPASDVAVQNDYDGDGKTDMAIWRPSTGMWHIRQSSNGQPRDVQWGGIINGVQDIPVPAYYRR